MDIEKKTILELLEENVEKSVMHLMYWNKTRQITGEMEEKHTLPNTKNVEFEIDT